MNFAPSNEQVAILDAIDTHNVVIDAVPGSGKTTSILFILEKYADAESILVLTYNAKLRHETRQKVKEMGFLIEPEVHTFHSFCYNKWQEKQCQTDTGIKKIINHKLEPVEDIQYSMVIVDEAQDLTALYMQVVRLTLTRDTKIIMLGDKKQSIYQFNDADNRFLKYAAKLNKLSNRPYVKLTLSTSYRMSAPVVSFLNNCILGEHRIKPNPTKNTAEYIKPIYYVDNFSDSEFEGVERLTNRIIKYIDAGYRFDDIFILAPSLKGNSFDLDEINNVSSLNRNSFRRNNKEGIDWGRKLRYHPIQMLALFLTWKIHAHYNGRGGVFIQTSEDTSIENKDVQNKIVFCTFHKAKGLERKIVIVFGFDESYFTYYAKKVDPTVCPNTLYVALTRSMNHLIVCHSKSKQAVQFLNQNLLPQYADMAGKIRVDASASPPPKIVAFGVTYLLRHVRSRYIDIFMEQLQCKKLFGPAQIINLPNRKKTTAKGVEMQEIVWEINGRFITDLMAIFVGDKSRMEKYEAQLKILGTTEFDIKNPYCELFQDHVIESLLCRATRLSSQDDGYIHKDIQIKRFNWLKSQHVESLIRRMSKILKVTRESKMEFESRICTTINDIEIVGYTDIVDHDRKIVWEIKCVAELMDVHFLQLALYKFLHASNGRYLDYKYYLFNVKTCDIWRVDGEFDDLRKILKKLVKLKLGEEIEQMLNDEEFIERYSFNLNE